MRYSFHGRMRFTGQAVDGFIEANNSTEAIDRLADEGVIGVYTVRPVPSVSKPQMLLDGAHASAAADPNVAPMMDKLTQLIAQVEKMLAARPSGPVRGESKGTRKVKSGPDDEQNSALRAIFENNLDLRRSIEKLTNGAKSSHAIGMSVQPAA